MELSNSDLFNWDLLKQFIAIQSVSSDVTKVADCRQAANFLVEYIENIPGASAELIDRGFAHPLVRATVEPENTKKAAKTLFYGHYDVQPAENIADWSSDPFTLTNRDNRLVARGIADDKGQVFAFLEALRQLAVSGELAAPVELLIEGEEEVGSPGLQQWLQSNKTRDKYRGCLVFDSDMRAGTPQITNSLRGLIMFSLHVSSKRFQSPLHSGLYGGSVQEAAKVLVDLISNLESDGAIELPGFYDDIDPSLEEMLQASSDPMARSQFAPSFSVHSLDTGLPVAASGSMIQPTASTVVSLRLVANQDPQKIKLALTQYLTELTPNQFKLELNFKDLVDPVFVDLEQNEFYDEVQLAFHKVYDRDAVSVASGGSIGVMSSFQKYWNLQPLLTGFVYPDANIHGIDENMPLVEFENAIQFSKQILSVN